MKKIIISIACLSLMFATGCKKEIIDLQNKGNLSFSIVSEGEFTTPTKAENVDVNDFSVVITNTATSATYNSWSKFSQVPSVVAMDPGSYSITATSPGNKDAAWDQPLYSGVQNFTVEAGKVVNIALVCTLKNMKVTIQCTNRFFTELNDDFTVTVATQYGFLVYTKDIITAGTAGYFKVAPMTLYIQGTRKLDNSVVNQYVEVSTVAEKDHHVFTIDARETGQINFGQSGITIDYTVNNKEQDIYIPGFDEDPIDDENGGTPVLTNCSVTAGSTVATTIDSITVVYSLPIKLANNANITLGDVSLTKSVNDKTLKIYFSTLTASTNYTLSIPAGAILNSTDDSPAAAYSVSFSTQSAGNQEVPITITSPGISENYTYPGGTVTFDVQISATQGINQLTVELQSQSLIDVIAGLDNGCEAQVDLANMNASETEFYGDLFGITSSDVKNQTSVSFSIGPFIPLMPVGTNPLKVTVKDNDNNVKSATVTIVIPAS